MLRNNLAKATAYIFACLSMLTIASAAILLLQNSIARADRDLRGSGTAYVVSGADANGCINIDYTANGWVSSVVQGQTTAVTNKKTYIGQNNIMLVSNCGCSGWYKQCSPYQGNDISLSGSSLYQGEVSGVQGQTFTYGGLGMSINAGVFVPQIPGATATRSYDLYSCQSSAPGAVHVGDMSCAPEDALKKAESDYASRGIWWYECNNGPFSVCVHRKYPPIYWWVDVDATVDKPVARPGEYVTFTYTATFRSQSSVSMGGAPGTEAEGTAAITNSDPVHINIYTDNAGPQSYISDTIVGAPGETKSWTVRKLIDQNDVGHDVVGIIEASPISWRCRYHGECLDKATAQADVTVHYNWDNDLKSERKVDSPKWREPKPYGTTIVNAYPQDKVTFKHMGSLRYHYIGDSLYTKTNRDINYFDHNTILGDKWVDRWGVGTYPGTSRPVVEGYVNNTHEPLYVTQDNVDTTMCEHITAQPGAFHPYWRYHDQRGYFDPERSSNEVCVHFPYHYVYERPHYGPVDKSKLCAFTATCPNNIVPKDQANKGGVGIRVRNTMKDVDKNRPSDRVLLGDGISFESQMWLSHGRTKTKPYQYHAYIAVVDGSAVTSAATDGPLAYSNSHGFKNDDFNCTIKSGSPHKMDHHKIKGCYELCVNGDWDHNSKCESNRSPIPWNNDADGDKNLVRVPYNGVFSPTLFNQAKPQPGDKICYWAAISDWSVIDDVSASSILVSNMECIDVAKQPQLKILGGDSIAGGEISSSDYNPVNPINGNRGSWSQYGLFANGEIHRFGSAGFSNAWNVYWRNSCRLSYANDIGLTSKDSCKIDNKHLGSFGMVSDSSPNYKPRIPDVDETKLSLTRDSTIDLGRDGRIQPNKATGIVYKNYKKLHIKGKLPDGAKVVIYVPSYRSGENTPEVDIDDNIEPVHKTFNSLSDIPSLTIIADNDINIKSNVTNIFGNYVTRRGHIYTCAEDKNKSSSSDISNMKISSELGTTQKCNNNGLKVQGALISYDNIVFHRTYGAENFKESTRSIPSEEVDYTPNTFLLPYYQSYKFEDKTNFVVRTANNMIPRY